MGVSKPTVTSENDAKSICEYCCKKFRCPKIPSAKSSRVWNARNNSSNVSSLLAPDLDEKSVSTNRTLVSKTIPKRCINSMALTRFSLDSPAHCENCYCRESPNLPLLDLRPVPRDEAKRKKSAVRRNIGEFGREKMGHGVKRIGKDHGSKGDWKCDFSKSSLSYTSTRHDYEAKSGDLEKTHETEDVGTSPDLREEESRLRIDGRTMSYKDFKELSKFRKEQYFDCHRMSDTVSYAVPEHKCVHKFILNDRLLAEPINCDSFGVSRCDICNKPMEAFVSETGDSRVAKKSVNNVKRIYEYNLRPPRLNIGCGNETVQIKVPQRVGKECLWEKPAFKIRRNVPGNSFALRYQRGCV